MRKYFEFYNGAKINCGEEALATIGTELSFFGCEKPLLITSKSETDEKAREKVTNLLKANAEAIVIADNLPATTNEEKIKEIKELYPGMSDVCVRFLDEKGNPVTNYSIKAQ